ncbi:MAG TPA: response regulator, partial [Geobacteraceae bacterium]
MMNKKPIIVIAVPDAYEFYRAIPLWDERIEICPAAAPFHQSKQLHADLVIIDCCFDDERGLQLLREMKLNHPTIPMIFMTDAGSEEAAIA